jgi:hypothetical protein
MYGRINPCEHSSNTSNLSRGCAGDAGRRDEALRQGAGAVTALDRMAIARPLTS